MPAHSQAFVDRVRRLWETHGSVQAASIAKITPKVLWAMKKRGWKAGVPHPPARPIPSDFAIQSEYMTQDELAAHYRTGTSVIVRWRREIGYKPKPGPHREYHRLPPPEDLRKTLARLNIGETAKHYGVDAKTLRRWRRELGLPIDHRAANKRYRKPVSMRGWVDRIAEQKRSQSGVAA